MKPGSGAGAKDEDSPIPPVIRPSPGLGTLIYMTCTRFVLPLLALALGASSSSSSFASAGPAAPAPLTGTFAQATAPITAAPDNSVPIGGYSLVSLTENGQTTAPGSAATRPTLSFDGKRASGSSGCNSFGASYVARQKVLRFGALASTLRACPDDVDGLEAQFLKLLRGVNRFELSGAGGNQTLILFSGSNDRMVFAQNVGTGEVASVGIRSKYDGTWTLTRPPSGMQMSSDTRPTQFMLKGTDISGFDGCNQFSGKVNLSGGRLIFTGPVMSTKVFCPPQEANLVPLLTVGAAAAVQGKTLTLTDLNGGQWVLSKP